jgi:hypothetical protein
MPAKNLPPCGIYRTTAPIADGIPSGRLVYFHNHGDPGPGLYLPRAWNHNRAQFEPRGFTLPHPVEKLVATLRPLPAEGFYRVAQRFFCCEKHCTSFAPELLVQLGYNGEGQAILFVPELNANGLTVPQSGSLISDVTWQQLVPLQVAHGASLQRESDPTVH